MSARREARSGGECEGLGQEVRLQRDEGMWQPRPWAPTWQVNQKEEVRLSETRLKMVFSEPPCGETEGSGDRRRGRLWDSARVLGAPELCACGTVKGTHSTVCVFCHHFL